MCKIEVECRMQGQEWVQTAPEGCECKGGDEKVEHVLAVPIEARYVRIRLKEWRDGLSLRAGVLEKPSSKPLHGKIVLVKKDAKGDAQCLVAFDEETKWCKAADLVDVKAVELVSSLEARFARELAILKELLVL